MNDWIPLDELVISEKENCITVDSLYIGKKITKII